MKTVASIVSITFSCTLGACGAISDSSGTGDIKAENQCHEPVPPLDNTAELAPEAAQAGGS
jgi:hypothetical protein